MKTYEDGLRKAWAIAQKIMNPVNKGGYTGIEMMDIFGDNSADVIRNYTIEQVMEKLEAYENSKIIRVGDIVVDTYGNKGICVSEDLNGRGSVDIWYDDYNCPQMQYTKHLKKTGEHVDVKSITNGLISERR